jgi:hypothetical protein
MRLTAWVKRQGDGELSRIARVTGLAYSTVHKIFSGRAVPRYETALKISEATDGSVKIDDLYAASKHAAKLNHSENAIAGNGKTIVRQRASQRAVSR